MKKLLIKSNLAKSILTTIGKKHESAETISVLNKALGHKYIRRWPDPKNPKRWRYLYPSDFLKPILALKTLFGFKEEKVSDDYTKNNIQQDYGTDKKTFAAHVLEYFSNKLKWDAFFAKKANKEKYKTPQAGKGNGSGNGGGSKGGTGKPDSTAHGGKNKVDNGGKNGDTKGVSVNKSLMRKIWGLYSGQEEKQNGQSDRQDQAGTGRRKVSSTPETVQPGTNQPNGGGNGAETVRGATDNGVNALQLSGESGKRSGRDVRLTAKETSKIREQCLALLNSKKDEEMTEADKDLLRQYEGAGGLGEEGASTHGTLYEYYTPRNVVSKVWQIVDKYIPGAKSVLEPSAGVGRFAEDRPNDKFTLNEYDPISGRIAKILNPEAETTIGAFQAMFKPGKPYTGKKYDVVIGNPPYGSYEGLWKGKGEGADHKRYDEYFIDRGLDTLREGGVMAFVVPSSFLRNGDSAIKQRIAAKGKLLEAWRLPNGTFNTTGVGTDIILIRKEKGDPAQFSGNTYFANNPSMVIGTETTRTGRFGEEQYVALENGITFDDAINSINAAAVEATPIGVPTEVEELVEKIESEVKKTKKKKSDRTLSEAMKGNQNAAGKHDVDTAAEFNSKYNKAIATEALAIWKETNWDGSINVTDLQNTYFLEHSGNYVKTASGSWYDVVNFASGNIYDKLDSLERDKEYLTEAEYKRQKEILEKAKPKPQSIAEFEVSPLSDIADKFITSEIDSRAYNFKTNQFGSEPLTLKEAFLKWIRSVNGNDLGLSRQDVSVQDVVEYVNKKSVRAASGRNEAEKEANRLEADRMKTRRRETAERLFNQFMREELSLEDQGRLEETYNRQYNGTVQPDPTRIPVFLDGISKTFKGNSFTANDSQMKGVSWLANQGNGIVAFDVGVGKTITGVMAGVNDIQMGRCKRPLFPVPKAVKENWLLEVRELFPNIKINDLGNFSDIGKYKGADGKLNIEEGSISICTYEALEKIGFKDQTLDTDLKEAFIEALSATEGGDSKRKKAKDEESIMTKVGQASRTGDNWIDWEDTGFDHITVDEAHNFRNSFSKPKNKSRGDSDEFKDVPGGSTALRGLKLFAITQMIQKYNNGRNVHLLTATPFQNSPVEIYNMLSLVAREDLKKAGIYNFNEFLAQFAELKPEIAVDSKNNMIQKNVMKGFKNLPALQSLLNRYIMKIDGEDAGILRPDKKDHQVYLDMTPEQRDITEKIRAYMEAGPDPKKDPGATLRCINALRQAALSPMLVDGFNFLDPVAMAMAGITEGRIEVENTDFVKDSPKMKFVADSVAKLYKQHSDKGQIIHMPQGIDHYEDVKKYLVSQGVPADAIVFMAPAPKGKSAPPYLKAGDAGNDQKEEYKDAFNDPNNKVKIIIGSDTIKEGVNLNGNTIQTHATMLDWNPTGTQQLIGRSHRQGNAQGMVHITFPLINDSVDSFMYQKHDEKKSRLDTLWKSKATKMEIDEINPEELKFALIKDPKKRADLYIQERTAELRQREKIAEGTSNKIFTMAKERRGYANEIEDEQREIEKMRKAITDFNKKSDEAIIEEHGLDFDHSWSSTIYDNYASVQGKDIKEARKNYIEAVKAGISNSQKAISRAKGKMDTIDNTLKRYGVDKPDNDATIERVRKRFSEEAIQHKEQIKAIEGNREQFIKEAERQIKEEKRPGISVSEAVDQNVNDVAGLLYPMQVVRDREKTKQEVDAVLKKAFMGGKKIIARIKRRAV